MDMPVYLYELFGFLIALGSIIRFLGFIISLIGVIWGGLNIRRSMFSVLIISFILLTICGVNTGLYYFRIILMEFFKKGIC